MTLSGQKYHTATSYDRYRMTGHTLDWPNQPSVFKTYDGIDPITLPEVKQLPEASLWELTRIRKRDPENGVLNLDLLSKVFTLSFSLTAKSRQAGSDFFFRSVASAGALYPNELYLAAHAVDGLESGIYHYGIRNRTLVPLRSGDVSEETAALLEPGAKGFSACFFISGIFFRSAWKYRARAFRYVLLDAGHLLENLALALKALNLSFSIHYDFDDLNVEKLLGLDGKREVCLACVTISKVPSTSAPQPIPTTESSEVRVVETLPNRFKDASCVSGREVYYDEIGQAYQAGIGLPKSSETVSHPIQRLGVEPQKWENLPRSEPTETPITYPQAVFHRRSRRNYIDQKLSREQFIQFLNLVTDAACQDLPPGHRYASGLAIGFLAGEIEEIVPGFYLLDSLNRRYGLVNKGYLTYKMATVCLDQQWLRNASLHFLFMMSLKTADETWGPRSYRYAMLSAGRVGQIIYLGATALGLGCCGIGALYDGEARELLGLNETSALLYLVAAGPIKRR